MQWRRCVRAWRFYWDTAGRIWWTQFSAPVFAAGIPIERSAARCGGTDRSDRTGDWTLFSGELALPRRKHQGAAADFLNAAVGAAATLLRFSCRQGCRKWTSGLRFLGRRFSLWGWAALRARSDPALQGMDISEVCLVSGLAIAACASCVCFRFRRS